MTKAEISRLVELRSNAAALREQAALTEHQRHVLRVQLTEGLIGVPDDRGKPHSATTAQQAASADPRITALVIEVASLTRQAEVLDAQALGVEFEIRLALLTPPG